MATVWTVRYWRSIEQSFVHPLLHVLLDPTLPPSGRLTEPGFEQHLVGLQEMGPHEEGPAVTELEARHLQLGAHALDDRPVLAQSNWNG